MRNHTTHHDDCGCLTARYEARIATLEREVADAHFRDGNRTGGGLFARIATLEAEQSRLVESVAYWKGMWERFAADSLTWQAHAATLRKALVKFKWAAAPEQHGGTSAYPYEEIVALLAQTPAQSLAAHDAEVLERAALAIVEGRSCRARHPFQPGECEECHWFDGAANSARSALAAQEVKP